MDAARLSELASRFGLRNASSSFLRQTSHFGLDNMVNPLASRDISDMCQGTIPFSVDKAHAITLGVPCLVQVEDVLNIASDDPRSRSTPSTLLFRLTDGRQSFGAIELVPFGGRLSVKTTPGAKLRLGASTLIRRGQIMLTPEHVELVGWANATGNVWGTEYEAKVSDALRRAGLRAPGSVSFDALATSGPTQITGLGGIADLEDDHDDPDDGHDDAFWLQAIATEHSGLEQATNLS
jgi:hypothetical protein